MIPCDPASQLEEPNDLHWIGGIWSHGIIHGKFGLNPGQAELPSTSSKQDRPSIQGREGDTVVVPRVVTCDLSMQCGLQVEAIHTTPGLCMNII